MGNKCMLNFLIAYSLLISRIPISNWRMFYLKLKYTVDPFYFDPFSTKQVANIYIKC